MVLKQPFANLKPAKGRIAWKGKCSSMALKPLFGYPKHCELSAMEQAYHNARKEHLWFFCKRERTAKGRRYKLKKKSFVGQPPRENFMMCQVHGAPPPGWGSNSFVRPGQGRFDYGHSIFVLGHLPGSVKQLPCFGRPDSRLDGRPWPLSAQFGIRCRQ